MVNWLADKVKIQVSKTQYIDFFMSLFLFQLFYECVSFHVALLDIDRIYLFICSIVNPWQKGKRQIRSIPFLKLTKLILYLFEFEKGKYEAHVKYLRDPLHNKLDKHQKKKEIKKNVALTRRPKTGPKTQEVEEY